MAIHNNNIAPYYIAGNNGLTGFKTWECYMIIKYGKPGVFGVGGDYEYLLELPLYPDEVTEAISASWEKQSVLGRSAPLSAFAGTDLKSVQFNLDLHRDLLTGSFSHSASTMASIGAPISRTSSRITISISKRTIWNKNLVHKCK